LPLEANGLNKAFVILMHCRKVGYFFENWYSLLSPNQGQLLPLPKSNKVLNGTYPKAKMFYTICKKGNIRAIVVIILLVAQRYVG